MFESRWKPEPEFVFSGPNGLTGGKMRKSTSPDRIRAEALEAGSDVCQLWAELVDGPSRFGGRLAVEDAGGDPGRLRESCGPARLFPDIWTLRALLEDKLII